MAGLVVLAAVLRYRPALRRLARPGFWVTLVAVTLLSGTLMGALSTAEGTGWRTGLTLGVGMSLRAVFVTTCFAALGGAFLQSHPRGRVCDIIHKKN